MNRRGFFTWLSGLFGTGIAFAQQYQYPKPKPGTYPDVTVPPKLDVAKNDIFNPDVRVTYVPPQWHASLSVCAGQPANGQCPVCGTMAPTIKPGFQKINLTRCKRCNAAFWQEAE